MSISSIYVSLTGLLSFSRGLDVVSDNVANLNTPGFKATDVFFESLGQDLSAGGGSDAPGSVAGFGSDVGTRGRRLIPGELRSTGVVSNLAIDGSGFFVLSTADGLQYTRSGQFEFRPDGTIVDPQVRGTLQGFVGGRLSDLRLDLNQTSDAIPTTTVDFRGVLPGDAPTQQVQNVSVVDADGRERVLTLEFALDASAPPDRRSWNVSILEGGTSVGTGVVEFDLDGTPAAGANQIILSLDADSGAQSSVTLNFGTPGTNSGVISVAGSSNSTVTVADSDGRALGNLLEFAFGPDGVVTYRFSNGEVSSGPQLALANAPDPTALISSDGTYFSAKNEGETLAIGRPGSSALGLIVQSSLELANVELSREFADIVILQRGYQAASQVLNVSSQLIEDLYSQTSGR